MRTALALLSFILLAGCAGMSQDECLMADWQTIGFEDGAAGRSAVSIGEHRRACAKHGIAPDKAAYDAGYQEGIHTYCSFGRGRNAGAAGYARLQVCPGGSDYHAGYEEGLKNFCTYDAGYEFGLAGGSYQRICPQGAEPGFLEGYHFGREIYSLQSELHGLEHQLQEVLALREQNEEHQDALKQKMILDTSLTTEDRARILLDIDTLRDEDDDLEEQKDALRLQIADVQAQLLDLGVEL